jgi:large subunit ribosomal protein L22
MNIEDKKTKVKVRNVSQSPQKLRLIADLVRGKDVVQALDILEFTNKKGIFTLKKAVLSAIASAQEKFDTEKENLRISHISVDEAPTLKSGRYVSRGRSTRILKRKSHINLEVEVK